MKIPHIAFRRSSCLLLVLCINGIAFGANPAEIVEVIYELPSSTASEWCIGDARYEIDESTIVDTENKPIVGNLAIVAFETIETKNIATAITPLAISSESINDGPYIFLDENNQITSLTMQNGIVKTLTLHASHELLFQNSL